MAGSCYSTSLTADHQLHGRALPKFLAHLLLAVGVVAVPEFAARMDALPKGLNVNTARSAEYHADFLPTRASRQISVCWSSLSKALVEDCKI